MRSRLPHHCELDAADTAHLLEMWGHGPLLLAAAPVQPLHFLYSILDVCLEIKLLPSNPFVAQIWLQVVVSFCFPNLRLCLCPQALFVQFLYGFRRHLPKSWCNIHHGKHGYSNGSWCDGLVVNGRFNDIPKPDKVLKGCLSFFLLPEMLKAWRCSRSRFLVMYLDSDIDGDQSRIMT